MKELQHYYFFTIQWNNNMHKHTESHCPQCGGVLDVSLPVEVEDAIPKQGDWNVTVCCGIICKYNEDLQIIPATNKDMENLRKDSIVTYNSLRRAQTEIQLRKLTTS